MRIRFCRELIRPLFRNDGSKIMFIVLFSATSYHCNAKIFKNRENLGVGFYLDKGAFFEASQNKNPTPLGSFPENPCRYEIIIIENQCFSEY